jgi:HK97 family phage prohead protease
MDPLAIIEGYLSVFGNIDREGDIVDQGAYTKWLSENPTASPSVFWMHDWRKIPVGSTIRLWEDSYGLKMQARIDDTSAGRDLMAYWRGRGPSAELGASPGFLSKISIIDDVIHFTEIQLLEASVTVREFAANPLAKIQIVPTVGGENNE